MKWQLGYFDRGNTMGKLIEFILLLPVKLIAFTVLAVFVVSFGLIRHIPIMPLKYDDWYDDLRSKLASILE